MVRDANLSEEQAGVVARPITGGHLLVLARPGSGKTHTLAARANRLIEAGVEPGAILAMTFSNRAADELKDRLPGGAIWAGTFHAVAADILEEYGAAIGVHWPFRVCDQVWAEEIMLRAMAESGVPIPDDRVWRNRLLNESIRRVEDRKLLGIDDHAGRPNDLLTVDSTNRIDARYCQLLRDANALDFSDLITRTIELLASDETVADALRRRVTHILIDEMHDISLEQYALIQQLAPPTGGSQVFAVGDPDQAIYGWRRADALVAIDRFRRDYRPDVHYLSLNFRSQALIVAAADQLMHGLSHSKPTTPHRPGRVRPCWCEFPDGVAEAREVVTMIRRAMASRAHRGFGQFAVLFRTHAMGNAVEAELLGAEIPIHRVQSDRFFHNPEAQDSLRHLELAFGLHDPTFEPALNWPRVIVDEVAMVRLRRLAAMDGVPLLEIVRRIDEFQSRLTPLTRGALREFLMTLGRDLEPVVRLPISEALAPFLAVLRSRRGPVPLDTRDEVRDTLDHLETPLRPHLGALVAALRDGRPIVVSHPDEPDCVAAALIVRHTLAEYFGEAALPDAPPNPENAFTIVLGSELPPDECRFGIGCLATRTVGYGVAVRTWRLMQMLLMAGETHYDDPMLILDVETGDVHPNRAELLEVGLMPFSAAGEIFASLVRPSQPSAISPAATDIHGLGWVDVADAPKPSEILPDVLSRLCNQTLAGHNIDQFDLPVLRRAALDIGLDFAAPFTIDTCKMAKRLWPEEASHRLEDLVRRFEPDARQTHRVHDDCRLTARLLAELLAAARRDQEIDVLTECLPLVAASILVGGFPIVHDTAILCAIGSRAYGLGHGRQLCQAWRAAVGEGLAASVFAEFSRRELPAPEEDERWRRLEEGWQTAVSAFVASQGDQDIGRFLRYASLAQPIDALISRSSSQSETTLDPRNLAASERVNLMTVHSAKGLEWPIVFLVGVEDDSYPLYRAKTESEVAEERRCLYVGMTRAEDRLFLFSARQRNGYGKRCSRFLEPLLGKTVEIRHPSDGWRHS